MKKITHSLVLFQPWAIHIANGKMKYLVRTFNTHKRGRIGILSTKNYDKIWFEKTAKNVEEKIHYKSCIIGSVEIAAVLEIKSDKVKQKLSELGGIEYLKYYPKHMISSGKNGKLYIWIFRNAKRWDKEKIIEKRCGMQWCKLELIDE